LAKSLESLPTTDSPVAGISVELPAARARQPACFQLRFSAWRKLFPKRSVERRLAGYLNKREEILLDLSERLINAQEQERARIASELHDDMGQRLAVIAIEIELARQSLPAGETECHNRLTRVGNIANELSADVRDLSHRLHSSMLEHVGLVASVRDLCGEMGRRHGVYFHVAEHDVGPSIPAEVSLCLYRIVQECLSNILKHSGCDAAEIEIFGGAGKLRLRVRDNGVGFDPERRGAGFGLISMKERLRILNGKLKVLSRPMGGTEIMAEVPLAVIHHNRAMSMRAG
jgi:signal transduction histidine kinase